MTEHNNFKNTALMLIDMQYSIDDPSLGKRSNPDAEKVAGHLLHHWRENNWPIVHIRHDSVHETSPYHTSKPMHAFKVDVHPIGDETVIAKNTNNAFTGTNLEKHLRDQNINDLILCGVLIEHCVGLTAKHAASLGFNISVVGDAVAALDNTDLSGKYWTGDDIQNLMLKNIQDDYGQVVFSKEIIKIQ